MDTFKISIVKYETSPDYFVYTNRGKEFLYSIHKDNTDDTVWYFNIPENQTRLHFVTSDEIPVQNILKFAQAVITVRYGIIDFDTQLTVAAKRTLVVK